MGRNLTIRKIFKLLEYTVKRKKMPLEKMRRKETANFQVNSDTFVDPEVTAKEEEERLKDKDVHPGDSGMNYY